MNLLAASRSAALAALALAIVMPAPEAQATDRKRYAASNVCAPFTSSTPDFALLRFRPEGIINDSSSSKFVACSLPVDSETAWNVPGTVGLSVMFRRTTAGTPAVTHNQCTVTVGFNGTDPLQSGTFAAEKTSPTYGTINVVNEMPIGDGASYATMVCRIVPGSLMDLIIVTEVDPTEQ